MLMISEQTIAKLNISEVLFLEGISALRISGAVQSNSKNPILTTSYKNQEYSDEIISRILILKSKSYLMAVVFPSPSTPSIHSQ